MWKIWCKYNLNTATETQYVLYDFSSATSTLCYLPYLWYFRKYTTTIITTNARHSPLPAAIPASIAILDGDSSGANKQINKNIILIKHI